MDGWKYYNHAAVQTCAAHEIPNISPIIDGTIWKMGGGTPLLARWTEDWDCGYETNWWYVIKDEPFYIDAVKSNYRYKINKGLKYFEVQAIDQKKYCSQIAEVYKKSFEAYPAKYRPKFDESNFLPIDDPNYTYYGAFEKTSGKLCGIVLLKKSSEKSYELISQKAIPEYEKFQINAALVYGILCSNEDFLKCGYINDGERNILHETAFQNYLEKYFGFRKAYCKLNIAYNPKLRWLVKLIYPFRRIFLLLDNINIFHQVNGVMKMEEIVRQK